MKLSVSATCLDQEAFQAGVLALADQAVEDLHCDYFPELDGAPSLSLEQIDWCLAVWPRTVTLHLWGVRGLTDVMRRRPDRSRLLVQLHDASPASTGLVAQAAAAGWRVGVSLTPELVGPVAGPAPLDVAAVQVLSTSTPGHPGGTFLPAAWTALAELSRLRRERDENWSIEVDGGITLDRLDRLAGLCDISVIGSNYLRDRDALRRLDRHESQEGEWALSSTTR
jgi:hypothetical protein